MKNVTSTDFKPDGTVPNLVVMLRPAGMIIEVLVVSAPLLAAVAGTAARPEIAIAETASVARMVNRVVLRGLLVVTAGVV